MYGRFLCAVALAACYRPEDRPCEIACDFDNAGGVCPDGLDCVPGPFFTGGICVDPAAPTTACASDTAGQPFADPLGFVSTVNEDDDPSLTGDLLELYILSNTNLLVSTRLDATLKFTDVSTILELDAAETQLRPCVSLDGLTLLFARRLAASNDDVFISTRPSRKDPWSTPEPLRGDVNTDANELPAWISPDGLSIVFEAHDGDLPSDLFVAHRQLDETFMRGGELAVVNSSSHDGRGGFDATGTSFVFESDRGGTLEIWEAYLGQAGWVLVPHSELTSAQTEGTPWLSPDGRTVVFSSNRTNPGNDDLFQATR